ncbi:alginate export family protein [Methylophilus methylotrophus]|uniref:alginate export family protein n=1 Tax=Methylophilus methylotrophus TaxID=17 RepID=UPI000368D2E7|nr:alginate export family protein [Methylophilus methylotrophus]
MQVKKLSLALATAGLWWLGSSVAFAQELQVTESSVDSAQQQEKINARLAEIAAEEKAAKLAANGHFVDRRSYGTQKETDPPRYVRQANKTWLKDFDSFADVDWLDLGLEYRARYEYRDNDFRRRDENLDQPILLRTRAFVGVKNILDPLRFAIELQDSRRNNGDYTREFDTRDINYLHVLQGYFELNFKDSFLDKDDLGNARPAWVRYGRHAWEAIDRRLIARNEWRNTTNNFQGWRGNIGDKKNDWQLEWFAVQPIQRFTRENDEVNKSQDFYGVIGDYRGWSDYVTFEPYYLLLKQDGDKVKYDTDGRPAVASAKVDREIHTGGLRVYGNIPGTQFDYDASYIKQWGDVQRLVGASLIKVDHDAYAYNAEIGYSFKHPWKPRFSVFYGVASGDRTTPSGADRTDSGRFDRLFGFARPWSNDDYIQMENIRTPKIRLEFEPKIAFLDRVQVDTGFSWYQLDQASDRWNAGANLQDRTGRSGKDLGKEYDLRIRFPINQYASLNLGYAHFWAGDFVKTTSRRVAGQSDRAADSDFFYTELTLLGF